MQWAMHNFTQKYAQEIKDEARDEVISTTSPLTRAFRDEKVPGVEIWAFHISHVEFENAWLHPNQSRVVEKKVSEWITEFQFPKEVTRQKLNNNTKIFIVTIPVSHLLTIKKL
jgi:hypothetical protein